MSDPVVDYFRCPRSFLPALVPPARTEEPGFFRFGEGTTCYGRAAVATPRHLNGNDLPDLLDRVSASGDSVLLPFDAEAILQNFLYETYLDPPKSPLGKVISTEWIRRVYYAVRPLLADSLRRALQRFYLRDWQNIRFPKWPVDTSVEQFMKSLLAVSAQQRGVTEVPFVWFWPDGANAAAIVTHDVETTSGLGFIDQLLDIDDEFGVKAAYQLVPEERYTVSQELIRTIRDRQCEVNVHGLNHNENLFGDRKAYLRMAELINSYIDDFQAEGFRSPCMYRNSRWLESLNISYDMSVPNVAHLEPQRGGCCTVFPYFVGSTLELPLTTVQDYGLFHILGDYSTNLWKSQTSSIMTNHGLVSFITHPDYLIESHALSVYRELLAYLRGLVQTQGLWMTRAGDVNRWWRQRSQMSVNLRERKWVVEGDGAEHARVAFARIQDGSVTYQVCSGSTAEAGREAQVFCRSSL